MALKHKLVLPLAMVLSAVMLYPLAFSAWISLHDYRLTRLKNIQWRGLENYSFMLSEPAFQNAMKNTLIFVFGAVFLELVIGLALAILVRKMLRFQNFTRSVLLAPMFITPIAVGLMFRFLLNSQMGVITHYLDIIGITIDWFGTELALFSIILIDVWQWTPFMLLMFLAGLESLPKAPFEAARVDGAGAWLTFRHVTMPMLRPVIVVALIIRALDAFKVFEYVFAITRGGPGDATETIMYFIYKTGFRFFRMGEAAAAAFLLIAVTMVLVVALVKVTKNNEERG